MMTRRIQWRLPLALLLTAIVAPTHAAPRPRLALLPTQYFDADAQSAAAVTQGLSSALSRRGFRVVPVSHPGSYMLHRNYSDRDAIRFARGSHARFVAYPRLLAVGIPAGRARRIRLPHRPAAVLLLRIIDTRTGRATYGRQVGHEFVAEPGKDGRYHLTTQEGVATAAQALSAFHH